MNGIPQNYNFSEVAKRYEERIRNLMKMLSEISNENLEQVDFQKKLEEEIIDFEKMIDEECMIRAVATHKINMSLISRLRELNYDFKQDKNIPSYENIINMTVNSLKNIKININ
jgi:hypothetical protein